MCPVITLRQYRPKIAKAPAFGAFKVVNEMHVELGVLISNLERRFNKI